MLLSTTAETFAKHLSFSSEEHLNILSKGYFTEQQQQKIILEVASVRHLILATI